MTLAISPSDILNDLSSVGGHNVTVKFKLTPKMLTGKSYSSALDVVVTYIKRWGANEMDFEVGSGPQNSTTEGVFQVRLAGNSLTASSVVVTSLPLNSVSTPAKGLFSGPSGAPTTANKKSSGIAFTSRTNSTGFPPLRTSATQNLSLTFTSNPLRSQWQMGTGIMIKPQTTGSVLRLYSPPPGTGSPFRAIAFSSGSSLGLVPHLTRGSTLNTVTSSPPQSSPVTVITSGANVSGSSAAVANTNISNRAAAAGAAAAAGILAAGGSIAGAADAAGSAASAAVVAAGGNAAAAADAARAARAVAESASENEESGHDHDDNGTYQKQATAAPATATPAGITATSSAMSNLVTSATPVTTTLATLPSNGSLTSPNASATCTACANCPGFVFGAKWPDLGSTTSWADSPMDTEDDWDADIDDDEFSPEDADGEEGDVPESEGLGRRAFLGRFTRSARKRRHLDKRIVSAKKSTTLGQCTGFTRFVSKPPYYNAKNVADFEATPLTMDDTDRAFMNALIRWVIPISIPPGDCTTVSKWALLRTAQCTGDAPLPDGSMFSKVIGAGEQVWQIGGAPNRVNVNREVNIDHVYEAKYLDDFFSDLTANQGFTCDNLRTIWDSGDGSVLTNLYANLPSKTNPEFIGMSKALNSLKEAVTNKIWNKDLPLSWEKYGTIDKTTGIRSPKIILGLAFTITGKDAAGNQVSFDAANDLEELTTAAQVLDLVNTPDAIRYMSTPNDRIYAAFQAYGVPCQGGPSWADRYKSYILNRFATRNVQLQDLFSRVLVKIPASYRADYMVAWKNQYPIGRMQLPPPTSWAAEFPPIQQAIQAEFVKNPASLGKRQAVGPAGGSCQMTAAKEGSSSHLNASSSALASLIVTPTTTPVPVVTPPAASLSSTAMTAAPSNGDPCGPLVQDNPNYPNTCNAKVNLTTTPEAYGVYCGSDAPSSTKWTGCDAAYRTTCHNILLTEYPKGVWVWTDPGAGCAVGVWMPTGSDSALTPSIDRCETLIFKAMADICSTTTDPSNVASVNLNTLPSFSDKTQTGSQVNVGYPSYLLAPKSPPGLTELASNMGWSTAPLGDGVGLNNNNQIPGTETSNGQANVPHRDGSPVRDDIGLINGGDRSVPF